MESNGGNGRADARSEMRPHEQFLELCAISTSGELTEEERQMLKAHLAECSECQQALQEFEAAVDLGMPLLSAELSRIPAEQPAVLSEAEAEPVVVPAQEESKTLTIAQRYGHRRTHVNWSLVWLPFAACILLAISLSIYAYRMGRSRSAQVVPAPSTAADPRVNALEQEISDAGHERKVLTGQLTERDHVIADLRRQIGQQAATLDEMKSAQANLQKSLQTEQANNQQVMVQQAAAAQKLDAAQASAQKMQAELDSAQQLRAQDQERSETLTAQVLDLSSQLRDREQILSKDQELLGHDKDIRDLMGARDLYIAEVYDVARDGSTRKPFGRVFYTKGKSLVFYAYDLRLARGSKGPESVDNTLQLPALCRPPGSTVLLGDGAEESRPWV
jgi:anti-sigma factor RsiW